MLKTITCFSLVLFLSSCKEPVASADSLKLEEEKEKMIAIETELAAVRIKAKEAKADPPQVPVAELEKKLASAQEELKTLNTKFGELEESYQEVTKKLEDYQAKYPLR